MYQNYMHKLLCFKNEKLWESKLSTREEAVRDHSSGGLPVRASISTTHYYISRCIIKKIYYLFSKFDERLIRPMA
jgi:hypothetical protein